LVRGAGAERIRRGSTGQGPWSMRVQGESEVSPGLEVHGGHEGPPGRVQRPKALLRGMQRGAKLPPCQDERPSGSVGGITAAHLASVMAMALFVLFRFVSSLQGAQNKTGMN
jgi:hypothetical protein